jgi:hypothetical protein
MDLVGRVYPVVPEETCTDTPTTGDFKFLTSGETMEQPAPFSTTRITPPGGLPKFYMEGVKPGAITLKWMLENSGGQASFEQTFVVTAPLSAVDKFVFGSFELPPEWEQAELEFVLAGENMGRYGSLLPSQTSTTKIYSSLDDILTAADITAGIQSSSQKVWFVRNSQNPRMLDFYVCAKDYGDVQVHCYPSPAASEPAFTLRKRLTPHPKMAEGIEFVQKWVRGVGFPSLSSDPFQATSAAVLPDSVNSQSGQPNNGSGAQIFDHLATPTLIRLFPIITLVEGGAAIIYGVFDGIKAGLIDDWDFVKLVGNLAVNAGGYAVTAAHAEMSRWIHSPEARARELLADLIALTDNLILTAQNASAVAATSIGSIFDSWDNFLAAAKRVALMPYTLAEKQIELVQKIWATASGGLGDALINWMDSLINRLELGANKTDFFAKPWSKDPLIEDIEKGTRFYSYAYGYFFGYILEQVFVGAVSGGAVTIGKLIGKEAIVAAVQIAKRTVSSVSFSMHVVKDSMRAFANQSKQFIDEAFEGMRQFVSHGVVQPVPLGPESKDIAFHMIDDAMPGGSAAGGGSWRWGHLTFDITNRRHIAKLVAKKGGARLLSDRLAQLTKLLGVEANLDVFLKNFMKVADERLLILHADNTMDDIFEAWFRAMSGNPANLVPANTELMPSTMAANFLDANGKARLKLLLSDPDPGDPWKLNAPDWLTGEPPPIPHNYWTRGMLIEIDTFVRKYKPDGYAHHPQQHGYDYSRAKYVQVKSLKNPDGAISAMKKAVDDLVEHSPAGTDLKLHICKQPGSSSADLRPKLERYIFDQGLKDRVELLIEEY